MNKIYLAIIMASALSGCGTLSQKQAKLVQPETIKGSGEFISMPPQLRTINIKNKNAEFQTCAEPSSDVALSDTLKLVTGITSSTTAGSTVGTDSANASNNIGVNNDLQTSTTALELAGRTQVVLLAREFMYRTCEAAANGWLDDSNVLSNHKEIIKQITSMLEIDKAKQKAKAASAEAAASAIKKLELKALGNAGAAISLSVKNHCMTIYDACIIKASNNATEAKKCRAQLDNCLN